MTIITFVLIGLLDFLYYRIPNILVYFLFVLFPFYILFKHDYSLLNNYFLFLGTLAVGFIFFSLNFFGAGDAKMMAVTSLWVGWAKISPFLLLMGMLGGGLGVIYLCFPMFLKKLTAFGRLVCRKVPFLHQLLILFIKDQDVIEDELIQMHEKKMIPYGIAIATAAIIVLSGFVQ